MLVDDAWQSALGAASRTKRTANDRAIEILRDAIARHGTIPPACEHIPLDTPCVTEDVWRNLCEMGCISEGDEASTARAFRRAAKAHLDAGRIGKWKPWVWIIR